ncbi:MAG: hypothetical protein K8W52_37170 [Deltaproteobacteria bacterium]|nr:hypothetical protein [Deltaproteobacteria bacterium]
MRCVCAAIFLASVVGCGGSTPPADPDAPVVPDAAPVAVCTQLGLPAAPWLEGETGPRRGDLAGDFTAPLVGGGSLGLKAAWSGCEVWVFAPDAIPISGADATSTWTQDLPALLAASPKNAHYVFVPVGNDDAAAHTSAAAMQTRVDAALAALPAADADHWRTRVHVVDARAGALVNWVTLTLSAGGRTGFVIDRDQRIRGVGSLADVARFDQALNDAGQWPFKNNLAYLANEVRYANARALDEAALAAEGGTVVTLWDHELVSGFADKAITLPALDGFDAMTVEVTLECPSPTAIEQGNCGAWDYIANLFVVNGTATTELARFITPYHREARWIVDASPMLPLLTEGTQMLRWSDAPSWNLQPTYVTVKLHLAHRGGARPTAAIPLWTGGNFDATYAAGHPAMDVAIPADATKVELVAIVTGHGSASDAQCAEFCDHHHAFTVGGATHTIAFPDAGTEAGCMANVDHGMTPNQSGTWWYGRGGWCPGQQVAPVVFDITSEVTKGGTATIGYDATFGGAAPATDHGVIQLSSWLVISK